MSTSLIRFLTIILTGRLRTSFIGTSKQKTSERFKFTDSKLKRNSRTCCFHSCTAFWFKNNNTTNVNFRCSLCQNQNYMNKTNAIQSSTKTNSLLNYCHYFSENGTNWKEITQLNLKI